MKERVVAWLTDFGLKDPFVGVMKAVALSRAKRPVRFLDLTHEVPPQDVRCAAFFLWACVPYLPEGALVVAVVDPGVGSARRVLWARSKRLEFLAPDNGLLSWAARREPLLEVRSVENGEFFLGTASATFHGRDKFAPVAAALASGSKPARLGPRVRGLVELPAPASRRLGPCVTGEVLASDRFGNCWTNLDPAKLPPGGEVFVKGTRIGPLRTHYAEVPTGRPLAVAGSFGVVELSVREGDFRARFGAVPGTEVLYRLKEAA